MLGIYTESVSDSVDKYTISLADPNLDTIVKACVTRLTHPVSVVEGMSGRFAAFISRLPLAGRGRDLPVTE